MKNKFDAIIIGGGAAGMMAAIVATRKGKNILIVEKNQKLGKKILVTGNGRCNISNENVTKDLSRPIHYFGTEPKFVLNALNQFGVYETKQFFRELGIELKEEDNGRLFPVSNQAQAVVDVLEYEMKNLEIKTAKPNVPKVIKYDEKAELFEIVLTDGRHVFAPKLVISTGGKSHEKLGTSGDGYRYAEQFGHTITPLFPAHVPVLVKSPLCHSLQGVKVEVNIKAYANNKVFTENHGTIMFAHFGLSAPAILEISRDIAEQTLIKQNPVAVEVNFLPQINKDQLDQYLIERWKQSPNKSLGFSLVGLLPYKVFPAILETEGIDSSQKVSEVTKKTRNRISRLLQSYRFDINGIRGFDDAHFTAGGVSVKEVHPETLASKKQQGLYFCGEILDIDGECGGYNLQWAWSSGYIVGKNL